MTGPADEGREMERPALSLLDLPWLSSIQCYGVLVHLINSSDEAVQRALSDAVARVLIRTGPAPWPPA